MNLANFREYLSQLNWLVVLFTLLVFSGLIKLGLWQTARAVEKEQRLVRIAAYQTQQALTVEQLSHLQLANEDINDIPLKLSGRFESEKVFLIDNQTNNGRLGYRVIQVFQSSHGSVLVNLGWVQGFIERDKLPHITPLSGDYIIKGNVRLVEPSIVLTEQSFDVVSWPLRVQQIDLEKFSQLIGEKLLPFVVYLDTKEDIGYEKNWRPIVMPPAKHRGYAFQWFSLATAWLILMISASVWFYKNNNE